MRRLTWHASLLVLALIGVRAGAEPRFAIETFCEDVQRITAETSLPLTLELHPTSAAFRHSKPGVDPVVIHEYVSTDSRGRPKMISCKVKSVDHLKAVHGPAAAGSQGTCEQVTRDVVARARATAGPGAPALIVEPEERVWTGSSYLSPFELLTVDASGAIHVHTRYMRIDWDDWRWYVMPNRLRGHLYCHVIAPDYAALILRGQSPELQPIDIPPGPDSD